MATARGLGKGLDTLIPTGKVEVKSKKSTEKSNEVKEPTTTVKIIAKNTNIFIFLFPFLSIIIIP